MINELVGKTITKIDRAAHDDELTFHTEDGSTYKM